MKKLIFILLKIAEVTAFIAIEYLLGLLIENTIIIDWLNSISTPLCIAIFLSFIGILLVYLFHSGDFMRWINLNKKWSDGIVKWLKQK